MTAQPPEVADPPQTAAEPVDATPPPPLLQRESYDHIQVLKPVDYGGLVTKAMSQEEEGLSQLRRKAGDAGVVRYPDYAFVRGGRSNNDLIFVKFLECPQSARGTNMASMVVTAVL